MMISKLCPELTGLILPSRYYSRWLQPPVRLREFHKKKLGFYEFSMQANKNRAISWQSSYQYQELINYLVNERQIYIPSIDIQFFISFLLYPIPPNSSPIIVIIQRVLFGGIARMACPKVNHLPNLVFYQLSHIHHTNLAHPPSQFQCLVMNPREEDWREKQRSAIVDASLDGRRDHYHVFQYLQVSAKIPLSNFSHNFLRVEMDSFHRGTQAPTLISHLSVNWCVGIRFLEAWLGREYISIARGKT